MFLEKRKQEMDKYLKRQNEIKKYNVLINLPLYIDVEALDEKEAIAAALELIDEHLEKGSTITPEVKSITVMEQ